MKTKTFSIISTLTSIILAIVILLTTTSKITHGLAMALCFLDGFMLCMNF